MSAQLLIPKFAVFTCVSFFFTDALHHSHGSLARSLSRPVQVGLEIFLVIADLFRLVQISLSAALEIICSVLIF